MKKRFFVTLSLGLICLIQAQAQVKIGNNPQQIAPGALLELESTTQALVLPRMTTSQMQAILSPMPGMLIFNTDSNCLYLYKAGNLWSAINPAAGGSGSTETWPYRSNDGLIGAPGSAKGIVAIPGSGLVASGAYSHAEGLQSVASGIYSWASGFSDTASASSAFAIGYQNKSAGPYSFSAGFGNTSTGQSSFSLGQENADSGWASLAAGYKNRIAETASYSHTSGFGNRIAAGWSNQALGEDNIVNLGRANLALGKNNRASGNFQILAGLNNEAENGSSNFAAGEQNRIISGQSNFLAGYQNKAEGLYGAALGKNNQVFQQAAMALGQDNVNRGYASLAAGFGNQIDSTVQYSVALGQQNQVAAHQSGPLPGGRGSFTAGLSNYNSGYGSIALGVQARSTETYSLAANYHTLANSPAMSAFGHFNDTLSRFAGQALDARDILFTVGNGENNSNRRNSLTMLRNGFTSIHTKPTAGASVPRADLDIQGTGALIVPVGTTAERPVTPVAGMIRFCTDCPGGAVLQGYDGTQWVNL